MVQLGNGEVTVLAQGLLDIVSQGDVAVRGSGVFLNGLPGNLNCKGIARRLDLVEVFGGIPTMAGPILGGALHTFDCSD